MTDTLAAFILARLAEDEQAALAAKATRSGRWTTRDHESDPWLITDEGGGDFVVHDEGRPTNEEAAHIARHDPDRVLADVATKRRIVELHTHNGEHEHECPEWKWRDPDYPDDPVETETGWGVECLTLRLLALSHAEDPDYRAEWKL